MNITNFDYDLEHGFAWIETSDGKTVQCCLENGSGKIIMSDCGHNWGICGDVNGDAFEKYGENRCMKALFAKAKESGLEVVG